jgi:plastocyanin
MHRTRLFASVALVLAAVACSAGDGATRTDAEERPGGTSVPAPSTDPATPASTRRVDPRDGGLELGFGEFAITLEAGEIRPGPVTFVVRNRGELVHGFEIEIEIEIEEDGDSSGHGHGEDGDRFKLEGPAFGPGETVRLPANLAPGVYEIECFVAEHDDMGMRAILVVRRGAPLVPADRRTGVPDGVQISDFAFSPPRIEIETGAEVSWQNLDPTAHTVTADDGSFDSGTLDPRSAFSATFPEPGTFGYVCRIHPSMRGVVRVVDPT